ncbi:MAG: DUF4136 domain-containing protein [Ekhidna sp.]
MKHLIPLIVLVFLSSCSIKVHSLQKPNVDFQKHTTWCWMNSCDPLYQGPNAYYNKEIIDEIYNSIAINMYEKGYIQGDDNADLLVVFHLNVEQKEMELVNRDSFEYGQWDNNNSWIKDEYPELVRYLKGNLVIDVIDRSTGEVIWKSSTVGYSDLNQSLDKKKIRKNVKKAMKKLPGK